MAGKTCTKIEDIPTGEHYAIVESCSMHIPEEGPDYPAYTEYFTRYIAFTAIVEWEAEIRRRMESSYSHDKQFKAMHVIPAKIKTTISVNIEH